MEEITIKLSPEAIAVWKTYLKETEENQEITIEMIGEYFTEELNGNADAIAELLLGDY